MKQSGSPWLWQTFAVTFFCTYTTFDFPWSYFVFYNFSISCDLYMRSYEVIKGHLKSPTVEVIFFTKSELKLDHKISLLAQYNPICSRCVKWLGALCGHLGSLPVVHLKSRGHLRSKNNSKRAWDSTCMAKDTSYLDCDGRLHLLRIDRLETACEISNGTFLILSMLLQKNAEINRHAV